jgi:8-oxo-dGTP diphosphatase
MNDQLRLAGCIILNAKNEILLIHRNTPKRTQWEIPGGKIDEIVDGKIVRSGRSEEDTVSRELKEEVGVDVRIVRRLGAREFDEDTYTMHYTWFLGQITAGQPTIGEPDKYDDLRYFGQAELEVMRPELSGNTKNFLGAWIAGEFTINKDQNQP